MKKEAQKMNMKNLEEGLTGTRPVVVGWGHTRLRRDRKDNFNVGAFKAIQQMLAVPILSSSKCGELFIKPEKSQICAGGEVGKDSCLVCPKSILHHMFLLGRFWRASLAETGPSKRPD